MSPASGPLMFMREYRRCAAVAADRREPLIMQRVDDDVVFSNVGVHLLVGHVGQRVEPDRVHLRVNRDDGADAAFAAVGSAQATDHAVILALLGQERLDLSHMAALLLALGREVQNPQLSGLLLHGLNGVQGMDGQSVLGGDAIAGCKGLLKVDPGIDEQHRNPELQLGDHMADDAAGHLHRGDHRQPVAECFRRPMQQLVRSSVVERVIEFLQSSL